VEARTPHAAPNQSVRTTGPRATGQPIAARSDRRYRELAPPTVVAAPKEPTKLLLEATTTANKSS
jgi:hypothetical protein